MVDRNSILSRRDFLALAGTGLVSAALASCSPRQSTPAPRDGNPIQLVYQDWNTDWFQPMAQEMLEEFHATHPHIRVFFTPDPDNLPDQMLSDMQAGIAPDVFQGCCAHFPAWAQKGYTLDLAPFVTADLDQTTIGDWNPAQYQAFFTDDGRQYGLPKYHGALALYYNKDLFDAYGITYPDESWDHDDYLTAMKELTHDQNGDGITDLWGSMLDISWERIQIHINGWGGHLVNPDDPTDCLMNEPEAKAALEWLRARMWDDKVMATNLDVQNLSTRQAFIKQRVAMVEDGSWALKDILLESSFRVGVAPFPAGPNRKVTLATTDGFGIYAGTKHPEAAWELVKFLISKDYGRAMAQANFLQPARASLVDDWVGYIQEEFPEKARDMNIAAFADGHINNYSVTTEKFSNMTEAIRISKAAWEQIFTLGESPTELTEDVCLQIEETQ